MSTYAWSETEPAQPYISEKTGTLSNVDRLGGIVYTSQWTHQELLNWQKTAASTTTESLSFSQDSISDS